MNKTEALEKTIRALADKATKGMQTLLSRQLIPPINPRGLTSNCNLIVNRMGSVITVESHFPDYAAYVQFGRRPGKMPPEKPIADWVRMHNIAPDAVFPIRKKIAREGTKPKPFTEPLRRMINLVEKTCLQWGVDYTREVVVQGWEAVSTAAN